jgi:hypothetical protein
MVVDRENSSRYAGQYTEKAVLDNGQGVVSQHNKLAGVNNFSPEIISIL